MLLKLLPSLHPEVLAALTMLSPTIVAACWVFWANDQQSPNKVSITIAGMGCIIHFPWSAMLHIYRAYGKNPQIRTLLYKLDVTFIHVHAICQGYSWTLMLSPIECAYHGLAICFIWSSNPLLHVEQKRWIDIVASVGVLISSFGLYARSQHYYFAALLMWIIALSIHSMKLFGTEFQLWFHLILGGPQYCLMAGLYLSKP